ncbi:hypothetical protein ACIA58_23935 [Kribbella sp. NPDC051586]|uniref:hypothetical protein n=1 Tax=Kribbella sp. NPDC051586 TaxID=3364118 RepID=UPI0037AEE921
MSRPDSRVEQVDDQAGSVADAAAARVRLAEWLSAEDPEYPVAADDITDWSVEREAEFLVFVPPGYANQVFLVADHGISWYAPSQKRFEDAVAAARAQR